MFLYNPTLVGDSFFKSSSSVLFIKNIPIIKGIPKTTILKRGFERDQFFEKAEKTFDKMFKYNRNYVESYKARKTFLKDPRKYYSHLNTLSLTEKRIAFMMLGKAGIVIPHLNISPSQINFALKQIRKALEVGIRSSSIGY